MLYFIGFVAIGVVVGLLPLPGRTRNLAMDVAGTLVGSLVGGLLVPRYLTPGAPGVWSLVFACVLSFVALWLVDPRALRALVARLPLRPPGSAAPDLAGPHSRSRAVLAGLVLYGLVMSLLAVQHAYRTLPTTLVLMQSRQQTITSAAAEMRAGRPPLTAVASGQYVAAGRYDDEGIYYYAPLMMNAFGLSTPEAALKLLFIACYALLVLVFPVVSWLLFRSGAVALLSPLPLLFKFASIMFNTDILWITTWVLLLGLPVVFVAARYWSDNAVLWLAAVTILASFASSIRLHAGLPVLLAALALVLFKAATWRKRIAFAVLLLLCYLSIQPLAFDLIRTSRDTTLGIPLSKETANAHPIWHNIYIGFGYLPNPYGLQWKDEIAIEAVRRIDPGVLYLSPRYEAIARGLVLDLFLKDPRFVLATLGAKFWTVLIQAVDQFWLGTVVLLLLLWRGTQRRLLQGCTLLVLPAVLLGVLPPVLTMPNNGYQLGWLGAWGALWLLGFGAAISEMERLALGRLVPFGRASGESRAS